MKVLRNFKLIPDRLVGYFLKDDNGDIGYLRCPNKTLGTKWIATNSNGLRCEYAHRQEAVNALVAIYLEETNL